MIKPKPTPAPDVENKKLVVVSYAYMAAVIGVSVWQLVMFEKFAPWLGEYLGNGVTPEVTLLAIALIGAQVFSLPFLLRLSLSPLARLASALLAFLAPVAWAVVAIAGPGFTMRYFVFTVMVLLWAGASFWLLGGPKVLRLKKRS
ncbi:MAG TPA: hypothetical protein VJM32_02370 [Candidatus Saccharimonadales bacterium]|nr:hypothetical protein [Candidatus Saccharimonadales bacterium]